MLPDPLTLTIGGASKVLPRVSTQGDESTYRLQEGTTNWTLLVNHKFATRNRCVARLEKESVVVDPISADNALVKATVTITADWPDEVTPAEMQTHYNGLLTFLTSANFLKVAGGET